jgi:phage terminase small subunit
MTPNQEKMARVRKHKKRRVTDGPNAPLSDRQRRFVEEYIVWNNGAEAARKAGYAIASARVTASQLLAKGNVRKAVAEQRALWLAKSEVTAELVKRDIHSAGTLDMAECFDAKGNLLAVVDMPPRIRRAIVSIEVVKRNLTGGDGHMDTVIKIRVINKGQMLEILGRVTGIDKGEEPAPAAPIPVFILPAGSKGPSIK